MSSNNSFYTSESRYYSFKNSDVFVSPNFARYYPVRRLGVGCCSRVWRAQKDTSSGGNSDADKSGGRFHESETVAVKLFRVGSEDYWANEVKILRHIQNTVTSSPHIIKFIDAFAFADMNTRDGTPRIYGCIVMEEGKCDLESLIMNDGLYVNGEYSLRWAKKYFCDLLRGLCTLGDAGIIHADIKPGNLFVVGDTLKIGDFGASCFVDKRPFSLRVGTNGFGAPETVLRYNYDKSIDIWASFVTFFYMITGVIMFDIDDEFGNNYGSETSCFPSYDDTDEESSQASDIHKSRRSSISNASDKSGAKTSSIAGTKSVSSVSDSSRFSQNSEFSETNDSENSPDVAENNTEVSENAELPKTDDDHDDSTISDSEVSTTGEYVRNVHKYFYLFEKIIGAAPMRLHSGLVYDDLILIGHPQINFMGLRGYIDANFTGIFDEEFRAQLADFMSLGLTYSDRISPEQALLHPFVSAE